MNRLEEDLKKALQRVEPPAGFTERVLARAAMEKSQKRARARSWFEWPGASGLRWATACALCVVLATSGVLYHRQQRRKGEEVKEQLMLALRITRSKLQIATESVRDINSTEQPGR
jgi:anti-sigma-K factor RskA